MNVSTLFLFRYTIDWCYVLCVRAYLICSNILFLFSPTDLSRQKWDFTVWRWLFSSPSLCLARTLVSSLSRHYHKMLVIVDQQVDLIKYDHANDPFSIFVSGEWTAALRKPKAPKAEWVHYMKIEISCYCILCSQRRQISEPRRYTIRPVSRSNVIAHVIAIFFFVVYFLDKQFKIEPEAISNCYIVNWRVLEGFF